MPAGKADRQAGRQTGRQVVVHATTLMALEAVQTGQRPVQSVVYRTSFVGTPTLQYFKTEYIRQQPHGTSSFHRAQAETWHPRAPGSAVLNREYTSPKTL